jgi:uncharacterized protein
MEFPEFKYHPDPIKSDVVDESDTTCICCGESRGYIYSGPVYAIEELNEQLCPWCIQSGEAAEKFDASFSDSHPLITAGIDRNVIDEVTLRTPGFTTWQQEEWLTHCKDACAFKGDATKETLKKLTPPERGAIFAQPEINDAAWNDLMSYYEPGGDPAIYHFECIHCKKQLFNYDCS